MLNPTPSKSEAGETETVAIEYILVPLGSYTLLELLDEKQPVNSSYCIWNHAR